MLRKKGKGFVETGNDARTKARITEEGGHLFVEFFLSAFLPYQEGGQAASELDEGDFAKVPAVCDAKGDFIRDGAEEIGILEKEDVVEGRKHGMEGAFDGFRDFAAARGAGKDFEDPLFRAWGFCLKKRGQKQRTEGIQVPPFRSQVNF